MTVIHNPYAKRNQNQPQRQGVQVAPKQQIPYKTVPVPGTGKHTTNAPVATAAPRLASSLSSDKAKPGIVTGSSLISSTVRFFKPSLNQSMTAANTTVKAAAPPARITPGGLSVQPSAVISSDPTTTTSSSAPSVSTSKKRSASSQGSAGHSFKARLKQEIQDLKRAKLAKVQQKIDQERQSQLELERTRKLAALEQERQLREQERLKKEQERLEKIQLKEQERLEKLRRKEEERVQREQARLQKEEERRQWLFQVEEERRLRLQQHYQQQQQFQQLQHQLRMNPTPQLAFPFAYPANQGNYQANPRPLPGIMPQGIPLPMTPMTATTPNHKNSSMFLNHPMGHVTPSPSHPSNGNSDHVPSPLAATVGSTPACVVSATSHAAVVASMAPTLAASVASFHGPPTEATCTAASRAEVTNISAPSTLGSKDEAVSFPENARRVIASDGLCMDISDPDKMNTKTAIGVRVTASSAIALRECNLEATMASPMRLFVECDNVDHSSAKDSLEGDKIDISPMVLSTENKEQRPFQVDREIPPNTTCSVTISKELSTDTANFPLSDSFSIPSEPSLPGSHTALVGLVSMPSSLGRSPSTLEPKPGENVTPVFLDLQAPMELGNDPTSTDRVTDSRQALNIEKASADGLMATRSDLGQSCNDESPPDSCQAVKAVQSDLGSTATAAFQAMPTPRSLGDFFPEAVDHSEYKAFVTSDTSVKKAMAPFPSSSGQVSTVELRQTVVFAPTTMNHGPTVAPNQHATPMTSSPSSMPWSHQQQVPSAMASWPPFLPGYAAGPAQNMFYQSPRIMYPPPPPPPPYPNMMSMHNSMHSAPNGAWNPWAWQSSHPPRHFQPFVPNRPPAFQHPNHLGAYPMGHRETTMAIPVKSARRVSQGVTGATPNLEKLVSALKSPSPFVSTHARLPEHIVIVRNTNETFGVNIRCERRSALVDPDWSDNDQGVSRRVQQPSASESKGNGSLVRDQGAGVPLNNATNPEAGEMIGTATENSMETEPSNAPGPGPAKQRRRRRRRVFFCVMYVVDAVKQNSRLSTLNKEHQANLEEGDLVLSINGKSVAGLTFQEACSLFRSSSHSESTDAAECAPLSATLVVARLKGKLKLAESPLKAAKPSNSPLLTTSPKRALIVKVDIKTTELAIILASCTMKTMTDPQRLLGQPVSEEGLLSSMAKTILAHHDTSTLQQKWNQLVQTVEQAMQDKASAHWRQKWLLETPDIRERYADGWSDSQRSRLRNRARQAKGCRCGKEDHEYVQDEKCALYSNLLRLATSDFNQGDDDSKQHKKGGHSETKSLNVVQAAFKDRIVNLKRATEMEAAEARFVSRMERIQVRQCKQAVFAPSLSTMVLSAVIALRQEFPSSSVEEDPSGKDQVSEDEDSCGEEDLPLAALGKRKHVDRSNEEAHLKIALSYLSRLISYISKTWGHVYHEPCHSEYAW
jgi:hypothetical protein